MSLLKTLDELERLSNEASANWSIDLHRSLNQSIERRLPIENFIGASMRRVPDLIQAIRKMREALQHYAKGCPVCKFNDRAGDCLKELGLE